MLRTLWLVGVLLCCSCGGKFSLSDSNARQLIEPLLNKSQGQRFEMGEISVFTAIHASTTRPNPSKREITLDTLPYYRAMETLGLVQFEKFKDLTKAFTGWNDFLTVSQNGYGIQFTVLPTDKGQKLYSCSTVAGEKLALCFKEKAEIKSVVRNEVISKPPATYRTVLGEVALTRDEMFVDVIQKATGRKLPVHYAMKYEAVLVYDEFSKAWKNNGVVYANMDQAVDENAVRRFME